MQEVPETYPSGQYSVIQYPWDMGVEDPPVPLLTHQTHCLTWLMNMVIGPQKTNNMWHGLMTSSTLDFLDGLMRHATSCYESMVRFEYGADPM